jgi:hypothetical protein
LAHILEADKPTSEAYSQLKAELTHMHVKTSWDGLAELFALPPCSVQKGTKVLAAMEGLKPEDPELLFRWQYFYPLPEWIQRQLAEDTSPVRELAKRVDELQREAPATMAAVPAPAAEIAAAEQRWLPKNTWAHKKPGDHKSPCSGNGGQGDAKKKPRPWEFLGICMPHDKYRDRARNCKPPYLMARN